MSHKSKLMLPILAAIVGIAASAFTTSHKTQADDAYWFRYTGDESQGQQSNSSFYIYDASTPSCNASTDKECYLELQLSVAPALNSHPDFSNNKVTTDPITGVPDGGTTFSSNRTKQ